MLFGLAGIAVMAIATPAPTAKAPPVEQVSEPLPASAPVKVPAPPIVILFGLAAGAMLVRRKIF